MPFSAIPQKVPAYFLIVLSSIFLAGLIQWLHIGYSLHLRITDTLYPPSRAVSENSQQEGTSQEVTVVAIDEKSLDDTTGLGRWQNWQRRYYAQVIENLNAAGAKAIGLDVTFTREQQGISENDLKNLLLEPLAPSVTLSQLRSYTDLDVHPDDQVLADTLARYDNVVLAKYGIAPAETSEDFYRVTSEKATLKAFSDHATLGYIHLLPDDDSVIRKMLILLKRSDDGQNILEENFTLRIVRKYFGDDTTAVSLQNVYGDSYTLYADSYSFQTPSSTFTIPLEDHGQMLIRYRNPWTGFQRLSFVDVFQNQFDAEKVRGRIILIGATAPILQDLSPIPNSKQAPVPRVEIHAHALDTILHQKFLKNTPQLSLILSAGLAIIGSVFFLHFPLLIGTLAAAVLFFLTFLGARFSFQQGFILQLIPLFVTLAFCYLVALMYRYFTELKQKRYLKHAFAHYVSEIFIGDILEHPEKLKLGGDKRTITLFFSDISDFTAISETLTPENLVSQMNEYFTVMSEIITRNGGTVDKYEGDAIMAFFGAPIAYDDHAQRACQTAIECRRAMQLLNAKWRNEKKPSFDFRVGINTGEVIVGNIGSKKRFNYTAMGDAVNLASRLEKANKETQTRVLVSHSTYELARDTFAFQSRGSLNIRGKSEPVMVYELCTE